MDLKTWLRAEWDRVAGWSLVALGLLALVLGYRGIADTPFVVDQLSYLASGAAGGLFLLGLGGTLLVTADLKDEWRKLDRIERLLEEALGRDEGPDDHDGPPPPVRVDDDAVPARAPRAGRSRVRKLVAEAARFRAAPTTLERVVRSHVASALGAVVVGAAILLAVSAVQATDQSDVSPAIDAAARAAIGVVVATAACIGFCLLVRQQVRHRSARLLAPVLFGQLALVPAGRASADGPAVALAGMTRYHRPDCPAVAGGAAVPIGPRAGLEPCGLCHR